MQGSVWNSRAAQRAKQGKDLSVEKSENSLRFEEIGAKSFGLPIEHLPITFAFKSS
jgi:hypothetical protein